MVWVVAVEKKWAREMGSGRKRWWGDKEGEANLLFITLVSTANCR